MRGLNWIINLQGVILKPVSVVLCSVTIVAQSLVKVGDTLNLLSTLILNAAHWPLLAEIRLFLKGFTLGRYLVESFHKRAKALPRNFLVAE